jgi:large subunit ribosomal protein L3
LLQLQIRTHPISTTLRTLATISGSSSSSATQETASDQTAESSPSETTPTSITELINPPQKQWIPGLRRSGVLARKRGMTSFWDSDGIRIPVTVLEVRLDFGSESINERESNH